jgi:glutathione S-transferase
MADLPILYSFRRCPYAMRARLALLLADRTCEIREVLLRDKPAAMIAVSPKATVPVLLLPDGQVIDQSLDIMRWALGVPLDDPLVAANDGAFKRHLDHYKYPDRHGVDPQTSRTAGLAILEDYEERLRHHAFLQGETATPLDYAIMPFVRQFAAVDSAWFDAQSLPMLQHWLAQHIASHLFERAMIRLPQWHDGDAPTLFPAD